MFVRLEALGYRPILLRYPSSSAWLIRRVLTIFTEHNIGYIRHSLLYEYFSNHHIFFCSYDFLGAEFAVL